MHVSSHGGLVEPWQGLPSCSNPTQKAVPGRGFQAVDVVQQTSGQAAGHRLDRVRLNAAMQGWTRQALPYPVKRLIVRLVESRGVGRRTAQISRGRRRLRQRMISAFGLLSPCGG
jgi:hypothetical protein